MSRKKILYMIASFALLFMVLMRISYAFFNYTKTGSTNTISVGRLNFSSSQEETINLYNAFPISSSEVYNDTDNVDEIVIEIEGDTDYSGGVEYLISTTDTHIYTSSGKLVPISINIDVDDLGTENSSYFTARNSTNANIYKILSVGTIVGEQQLMVGYIKPNSTPGTADGIDGSITIKAYFDKDKIVITDTPEENEEWQEGRVVIPTNEWNALQTNGISFKVKVEANEGIWVGESFYNVMRTTASMDNINSTFVNNSTPGIDFSQISSDNNGKGLYIKSDTQDDPYPIMYYRGAVENNNVFFANKCWKIVRTTNTGGIKMIYNGENTGTADAPACNNTGTASQISLNVNGVDTNKFAFSGKNLNNSPAYLGYMYGTVYGLINGPYVDGAYFGNSFTYDETYNRYTLIDSKIDADGTHHYTCNLNVQDGTCSTIRYYFTYFSQNSHNYYLYFNLTNGKSIYDAMAEMQENNVDSNAKARVEQWYEENIMNTKYEKEIEDTIYCNDRTISNLRGLDPNGGKIGYGDSNANVIFSANNRAYTLYKPSLVCGRKNDSFTMSNEMGNGKLNYPVGLITIDEMILAGGKMEADNNSYYLYSKAHYYSMSPIVFHREGDARIGDFVYFSSPFNGALSAGSTSDNTIGIRPVISIKEGISVLSGLGTKSSPYIIE